MCSCTPWYPALVQSQSCLIPSNYMDCSTPGFPVSLTISQSLLKFMPIESVMLSNHLISANSFSSCLQTFPASGSFQMSSFFASLGQSIRASVSVLPVNIQGSLGLTGLISLQSKGLSGVFSSNTVSKCQFFGTQPSLWSNSHIHT